MDFDELEELAESINLREAGIPIRNIWYMLLYAWNEAPQFQTIISEDIEQAPTLDGLLCLVLIKLIQQRFRIGLGRNYVDESHLIRGIRGKIDFGESIKLNSFEKGQAYCSFQEYNINVPKNQIVRTTLMRMVRLGQFGPDSKFANDTRQRLRMVSKVMEGVDFIELNIDIIHRQQLGRNDRDYRVMLSICELLLRRYMPAYEKGDAQLPDIDRDRLVMYQVFEDFIANFYRYHLQDWHVLPQTIFKWHEKSGSKYLPSMRPDLVLIEKKSGSIIVLDTKYTRQTIQNRWGTEVLHSGHLYQMYAYLKTQEEISDQHMMASGILLYPASRSSKIDEHVILDNHTISIKNINLNIPWEVIETNLLRMITDNELVHQELALG